MIVSGTSIERYADPMGTNRWPIETCRNVFGDIGTFHRTAAATAARMDGAVIASIDGVLQPQMVRIKEPDRERRPRRGARPSPTRRGWDRDT
ncbi:hypothetical protein [Halococcus agarilyticus]|uniref:hypothetical protein n=1 Tax=Halococcus agarilyticus TaxID=1232219 RepID=UPI000B227893|nr:hypothetical protein [Halococcus agarilyticus]